VHTLWAAIVFGLSWPGVGLADVQVDGGESCVVKIHGEIQHADVAAIGAIACSPATIQLDSPGGDVDASMDIGRWLRANGHSAVAYPRCLGSCALVYIGAVKRENHGQIGLHRPALTGQAESKSLTKIAVAKKLLQIREYVEEMGIVSAFADIVIRTPPAAMQNYWYRGGQSIEPLVPVVDPSYIDPQATQSAGAY